MNEICSPAEQAAIAAFKNGASVNRVATLIGRTPGSVEWLLKKNGLKRNDHRKPRADEGGDAIAAPAVQSCRRADLAFQRAMHRAIKAGLEKPPMIGIYKDPGRSTRRGCSPRRPRVPAARARRRLRRPRLAVRLRLAYPSRHAAPQAPRPDRSERGEVMTSPRRAKRHRRAPTGSAPESAQTAVERSLTRLKRALRKAERRAGDGTVIGGTGATILKLQAPPVGRLLDKGRIGTEEVRAADDIAVAFRDATPGAATIRPSR